jgi:hypothetical protein
MVSQQAGDDGERATVNQKILRQIQIVLFLFRGILEKLIPLEPGV